jgi:hypothetical protein
MPFMSYDFSPKRNIPKRKILKEGKHASIARVCPIILLLVLKI